MRPLHAIRLHARQRRAGKTSLTSSVETAELIVHQDAGLLLWHTRRYGSYEGVVDDSLGGGNLRCLLRGQLASHPNIFFWNEPR
jgi:hypothetical protein